MFFSCFFWGVFFAKKWHTFVKSPPGGSKTHFLETVSGRFFVHFFTFFRVFSEFDGYWAFLTRQFFGTALPGGEFVKVLTNKF